MTTVSSKSQDLNSNWQSLLCIPQICPLCNLHVWLWKKSEHFFASVKHTWKKTSSLNWTVNVNFFSFIESEKKLEKKSKNGLKNNGRRKSVSWEQIFQIAQIWRFFYELIISTRDQRGKNTRNGAIIYTLPCSNKNPWKLGVRSWVTQ